MNIGLRPAVPADYAFCKSLYFTENQWILEALRLDPVAHEVKFPEQWKLPEVRIIVVDGLDIGWLQSAAHQDGIYLGQLYIARPFQRRGIAPSSCNASSPRPCRPFFPSSSTSSKSTQPCASTSVSASASPARKNTNST